MDGRKGVGKKAISDVKKSADFRPIRNNKAISDVKKFENFRPIRNRSAISDVVTTVMLILVSIVVIVIFWAIIKNVTKPDVDTSKFSVNLEIKSANLNGNILNIIVQRNPGEGNLTGVLIKVTKGKESYSYEKQGEIKELGIKSYSIDLSGRVANPDSVSIAGLFSSGKPGSIIDTKKVGISEQVNEQCTPSNSCQVNTCSGQTCTDSCGNSYSGTKNCAGCSPNNNICLGKECGSFANGTCGTISCGANSASCTAIVGTCNVAGTKTCSNGIYGSCVASSNPRDCSCANNICIGSTCSDGCGGSCSGTKTCLDLNRELISYYTFDSGTISNSILSDVSGNGYSGNIHGAISASGKIGEALFFRENTNYVDIPNYPNFQAMTISAWIYPISFETGYGAIAIRDRGTPGSGLGWDWAFYAESIFLRTLFARSSTASSNSYIFQMNQWNHIAMTFNKSSLTNNVIFYANGQEVGRDSSFKPTLYNTHDIIYIGRGSSLYDHPFNGKIDELKIWSRNLSSSEILEEYQRVAG